MIFGWLICRGPRTFRASIYYLYRYWICVRQALGTPVCSPLTLDQRQDFESLVKALAGAYKAYLTDQLATVEFPAGRRAASSSSEPPWPHRAARRRQLLRAFIIGCAYSLPPAVDKYEGASWHLLYLGGRGKGAR